MKFGICLTRQFIDLRFGKAYRIMQSEQNDRPFLRVVDESGEDYLYDPSLFAIVELDCDAAKTLEAKDATNDVVSDIPGGC